MIDTTLCCKTVLLVEDDEAILQVLQELLTLEGYNVATAKNGKEALERLEGVLHPCLILLDLFMPVMNGWEFLDYLKKDHPDVISTIPIVISSAAGDRAAETAKSLHGYIKKPIDIDLLLATVSRFCGLPPKKP